MLRKPRRHERLAIYKKMLKSFEADINYAVCTGFCYELVGISGSLKRSYDIRVYPELMKYKPEGVHVDAYWWPVISTSEGREIRMKILQEIIEKMSK